jgi:DNA primase
VDFSRGDVFREEKADTHILVLPDGHDPDSYLREKGTGPFEKAASHAPGIISFLIEQSIGMHGLSTEGKIRVVTDLKGPLAAINDNVARALYIKQLAERIGLEENIILEKVREDSSEKGKKDSRRQKKNTDQKGSRLEQQIIAMMLQFPGILSKIKKYNVIEYIENRHLQAIGKTILEYQLSSVEQISELLSRIDNPEQHRLVSALAMVEESWDESGCMNLIIQFVKKGQRRRDRQILDQIKAAEKENDQEALNRLLREKQKLAVRSQNQRLV